MSSLLATVKGVGRLFKVFSVIIATFVGSILVTAMIAYFYFARDLPNIQTISDYHPYVVSQVFGSNGNPIGEFWNEERRELASIEEIPPLLISAFLAAEDVRFFEHRGVDFKGTLRAFIANFKAGGIVQGGSTITQQVTRSLLLSRQRTFSRKIKEAILATRLERYLTKDQILYLYLNQIYFGNRAWGVKSAAHNYFHKNLNELNLSEMTLLAALPRAPELYSPIRHPDKAKERQEYVLSRMVSENVILPKEMREALETKLTISVQGTDKESNLSVAPHFMEYLRQVLLKKYGEETLYYGGLKIYTPLDPAMQQAAVAALQRGLEVFDRRRSGFRGAMDHVDPSAIETEKQRRHLEILESRHKRFVYFPSKENSKEEPTPIEPGQIYPAIVIGFEGQNTRAAIGKKEVIVPRKDISFDPTKLSYDEHLYLYDPPHRLKIGDIIRVRAMEDEKFAISQEPLVQGALYSQETGTGFVKTIVGGYDFTKSEFNRAMDALRQPGSSFKPFIYAAALDKGYMLRTPIADSPFSIPAGDEIWSPKNYDGKYRGLTTLHQAIVHSYNVATARIAYSIRLHYLTGYIRKLGITTPIFKYPSMALGANGVHLHEMVAAYATFPNLGKYNPPTFIIKVEDQEGNVLEEYQPSPVTELAPNTVDKEVELIKNPEDLNPELFQVAQETIGKDQLKLTPNEMKILYGKNIPSGHVITPQTSYLMVKLMEDVVKMGTGQRVKKLQRPVAGKTGTSNDETDTWFIGYVPDLAAGVWVGYDAVRSLGKGEQGGRTAAPIFLDFMQAATKDWQPKPFPTPAEVRGKDLFALPGGSSRFGGTLAIPTYGNTEGGSAQDRSADFLEANLEGTPLPQEVEEKQIDSSEEKKEVEEGF